MEHYNLIKQMNNQEIKQVEIEANKQGLEIDDLFLLQEIDEVENQTESDELSGLNLDINLE